MFVVSHRGRMNRPAGDVDNSMPTLAAAFACRRIHGVEVDVRSTADHALVITHDDTLQRVVCDGHGDGDESKEDEEVRSAPIASLSLQQVRSVRLRDGTRVPTFAEVLRLHRHCTDAKILFLDVKHVSRPAVRNLMGALRHHVRIVPACTVRLQSFDIGTLRMLQALAPDGIQTVLGFDDTHCPDGYVQAVKAGLEEFGAVSMCNLPTFVDADLLRAVGGARAGRVWVWTNRDAEPNSETARAYARVRTLPVAGFICDRPLDF
jgi:glycerophosphoryl diester phosphodiesterase